jgi:2-amino-4-hydroxy-6-hydroxymethyldihydropteridine diphosphokinase
LSSSVADRDLAFIALGSNLGDRDVALAFARRRIAALPQSRIVGETVIEETPPIGPVAQPPYLNQMVALETTLHPEALLDALLAIEREAGRVRAERWGPRVLDLDIVALRARMYRSERLEIPHPELPRRDFWQRQLLELEGCR